MNPMKDMFYASVSLSQSDTAITTVFRLLVQTSAGTVPATAPPWQTGQTRLALMQIPQYAHLHL